MWLSVGDYKKLTNFQPTSLYILNFNSNLLQSPINNSETEEKKWKGFFEKND